MNDHSMTMRTSLAQGSNLLHQGISGRRNLTIFPVHAMGTDPSCASPGAWTTLYVNTFYGTAAPRFGSGTVGS